MMSLSPKNWLKPLPALVEGVVASSTMATPPVAAGGVQAQLAVGEARGGRAAQGGVQLGQEVGVGEGRAGGAVDGHGPGAEVDIDALDDGAGGVGDGDRRLAGEVGEGGVGVQAGVLAGHAAGRGNRAGGVGGAVQLLGGAGDELAQLVGEVGQFLVAQFQQALDLAVGDVEGHDLAAAVGGDDGQIAVGRPD
jgi:hypothetical protein